MIFKANHLIFSFWDKKLEYFEISFDNS